MVQPHVTLTWIPSELGQRLVEGGGRLWAGIRRNGESLEVFGPCSPVDPGRLLPLFVHGLDRFLPNTPVDTGPRLEVRLIGDRQIPLARLTSAGAVLEVHTVRLLDGGLHFWKRPRGEMTQDFVPFTLPLERTHVAQVGASRGGSLSGSAAADAGFGELTLIDFDRVDSGNVDAMECDPDAMGRPKPEAVASYLLNRHPKFRVHALCVPVQSPAAFHAAAGADWIFSYPDENRARLTGALAAISHVRPLLDIGSGVFVDEQGRWSAGADVRFIAGGGCLACIGGLDLTRRAEPDWRRARAGSLRSLNRQAVALGLSLVLNWQQGHRRGSRWLRLTLDPSGMPRIAEQPLPAPTGRCPLCRYQATGSLALDLLTRGASERRSVR
jgi:hypothetical protein